MDPQTDQKSGLPIQLQLYTSAPTVKTSLLTKSMINNETSKHLGNNSVKGAGEGNIDADIEYRGKTKRIQLTGVMHVPETEGKILSLKVLAQKGFESHILEEWFCSQKMTRLTPKPCYVEKNTK